MRHWRGSGVLPVPEKALTCPRCAGMSAVPGAEPGAAGPV